MALGLMLMDRGDFGSGLPDISGYDAKQGMRLGCSNHLELRVIPVTSSPSRKHGLREERLPPACDHTPRIEVFWMERPQPHRNSKPVPGVSCSSRYSRPPVFVKHYYSSASSSRKSSPENPDLGRLDRARAGTKRPSKGASRR